MVGAIFLRNTYVDIIIFIYSGILAQIFTKESQHSQQSDDCQESEDCQSKNLGILNEFLHSMTKSSGKLVLKMKIQNDDMEQQVQSFTPMAKRMLKAEDEQKMLVRFKNSEFHQITEKQWNGIEDIIDIDQVQRKSLEYWIRRAAAMVLMQKEEEENNEKEKIIQMQIDQIQNDNLQNNQTQINSQKNDQIQNNQIQNDFLSLNPVSSIINNDILNSEKHLNKQGKIDQLFKNSSKKTKNVLSNIKSTENINVKNGSHLQKDKEIDGMNGGTLSNNNLLGVFGSSSLKQNSTLPHSSNNPQIGSSKTNDISNINIQNGSHIHSIQNGSILHNLQQVSNLNNTQSRSNIISNSNINNNNQNIGEDYLNGQFNSPLSNFDLLPFSDRRFYQNEEYVNFYQDQTINPELLRAQINKNEPLNGSNFNNQIGSYTNYQIGSNNKDQDIVQYEYSTQKNTKEGGYEAPNSAAIQSSKDNHKTNHKINYQINETMEQQINIKKSKKSQNKNDKLKKEDLNQDKQSNNMIGNEKTQQEYTKTKQKHSKQNLTHEDDKLLLDEQLISNYPKRKFIIEHFKGVLLISTSKEVYRKVTIGACMDDDEIFVIISIEKDLDYEKKINELRELLNQYESLYLKSLKCLKNLTYNAYLEIPKMDEDEKVNNLEGLWNKNNSVHLQLKVIINKIINLKDVLNLQKPIRSPLVTEKIEIMLLLSEIVSDFKPLLEEKNVSIYIQNTNQILTILNSPKRVKQVLFSMIHNAIKSTKKDYSVQIMIDYYMENTKIVRFHIINMLENQQGIPQASSLTMNMKDILKTANDSSSKKKKKDRRKNNIQIGLRVSNKILQLIGPKNGLTMKKVEGTFQTQFLIYSNASQNNQKEKLKSKKEDKVTNDEDIRQDSWIQSMEMYKQQQRILNLERGIDGENKLKSNANKFNDEEQ